MQTLHADFLILSQAAAADSSGVATGSGEVADQIPPPRPPAPKAALSACAAHAPFIHAQVQLGRNAQSIYQDLVEMRVFAHRYNSVKRFVRRLKVREPDRFDVLESQPGEEAQVDFGLGALTLHPTGKSILVGRCPFKGESSSLSGSKVSVRLSAPQVTRPQASQPPK